MRVQHVDSHIFFLATNNDTVRAFQNLQRSSKPVSGVNTHFHFCACTRFLPKGKGVLLCWSKPCTGFCFEKRLLSNFLLVFMILKCLIFFSPKGARGFPGAPGLPGLKGHRVSSTLPRLTSHHDLLIRVLWALFGDLHSSLCQFFLTGCDCYVHCWLVKSQCSFISYEFHWVL